MGYTVDTRTEEVWEDIPTASTGPAIVGKQRTPNVFNLTGRTIRLLVGMFGLWLFRKASANITENRHDVSPATPQEPS